MTDQIMTQIRFRKGIWTCKNCGKEDITDFSVTGGNTYEHNCSVCNAWSNKFKNFSGALTYTAEQYKAKKEADITLDKKKKCDAFINDYKNPPAIEIPSKEVLEAYKAEKQKEVDAIQADIDAKDLKEK